MEPETPVRAIPQPIQRSSFCREEHNVPLTLANLFQQILAFFGGCHETLSSWGNSLEPKGSDFDRLKLVSYALHLYWIEGLMCAFPSSISGVTTRATGRCGGLGIWGFGYFRRCCKTRIGTKKAVVFPQPVDMMRIVRIPARVWDQQSSWAGRVLHSGMCSLIISRITVQPIRARSMRMAWVLPP